MSGEIDKLQLWILFRTVDRDSKSVGELDARNLKITQRRRGYGGGAEDREDRRADNAETTEGTESQGRAETRFPVAWDEAGSVGCRGSSFDRGNVNCVFGALDSKEDAPVTDAASQPGISLEIFDVAGKRVRLHLVQGGAHARIVWRRDSLKRLLRGSGEDDAPRLLFGGVHLRW
jgi:hypothetical protein